MPAAVFPPGVQPQKREEETHKKDPWWLTLVDVLSTVLEIVADIGIGIALTASGNPEAIPAASVIVGLGFATFRTSMQMGFSSHVNGLSIGIDYAASFLPMIGAGVKAAKSSARIVKEFQKISGLTAKQMKILESKMVKKMAEQIDKVKFEMKKQVKDFNKLVNKTVGNNKLLNERKLVFGAKDFSTRAMRTNTIKRAKYLRKNITSLSKQLQGLRKEFRAFKFTNEFKTMEKRLVDIVETGEIPSYLKKTWKHSEWMKQTKALEKEFDFSKIPGMTETAVQRFTLSGKHIKTLSKSLDRIQKMEALIVKPKNKAVGQLVGMLISATAHISAQAEKHVPTQSVLKKIARKFGTGVLGMSEKRSWTARIRVQAKAAWEALEPAERAIFGTRREFEMAAYNFSNRKIYDVARHNLIRWSGSRRFNDAYVQTVQAMFDANDLGRWPVEKLYQFAKNKIGKAFKTSREKWTEELVQLEEKVILGTATKSEIEEVLGDKVLASMKKRDARQFRRLKERYMRQALKRAKKGTKATKNWKKIMNAEQRREWRRAGNELVPPNRYLIGYRILPMSANKAGKQAIILHFDKAHTMSDDPMSKNYGGKKDIVVTATKKEISNLKNIGVSYYWSHGKRNFWYTSRGGSSTDERALGIPHELSFFLGFLPIQSLRNVLSITSNVVENVADMANGTWSKAWTKKFVSSFEKTGVTRSIRLFMRSGMGGMIGKRLGDDALGGRIGRELQKYSSTGANLFIQKDTKNGGIKFHGIGNQNVAKKFGTAFLGSARTQSLRTSRTIMPHKIKGNDVLTKRWKENVKGQRGDIAKKVAAQRKFGYARRIPGALSPNSIFSPSKFGRIR